MISDRLVELEAFLKANQELCEWPHLVKAEPSDDDSQVSLLMQINADLIYFAGHFPSQAVLPGVVQTHWAAEFAKHLFGLSGFSQLKGMKFNTMILPGTQINLILSLKPLPSSVRFRFLHEAQICSTGTIQFAEGVA